ncbi:MAG: GNAT family N-acetyltransferase [Ignavibacteriales bacterium]
MGEKVIHDKAKSQFIMIVDGNKSFVDYLIENNKMYLHHTYTHPELRGKGYAAQVVTAALEYAEENNLKVVPSCTYVLAFISRNRKYIDLIAD